VGKQIWVCTQAKLKMGDTEGRTTETTDQLPAIANRCRHKTLREFFGLGTKKLKFFRESVRGKNAKCVGIISRESFFKCGGAR